MDKDAERKIAEGLREGDRRAWLGLYDAYSERLWNNVGRLTGFDNSVTADILQETFLEAARCARKFDESRGSLWMWLCGIARKQMALYYRKNDPKALLVQARKWWANLEGEKFEWLNATKDTPLDVLEAKELCALVRFALLKLPVEYQALLLAKYVDEKRVNEIAGESGSSEAAVTSKLARARKMFRVSFSKLVESTPNEREVSL